MEPPFINKQKIAALLPMKECIDVMQNMFRSLANGECVQPLRSIMQLPDKSGLLGMMPGYAGEMDVMGIKIITVFNNNSASGYPSHQGIVVLFDAKHGQPLMLFDAEEITAIRTAAVSAVATRLLSNNDAETLGIIGSGVQAEKHIEAIRFVRTIRQIHIWGRNKNNATLFANKMKDNYDIDVKVENDAEAVAKNTSIICTVTSSAQPVLKGEWVNKGTHINAVGFASTAGRELDTVAILKSKLFTDRYESLFNEAGDFLIPKKEGAITDDFVKAEIGEILVGNKQGRINAEDITVFKSLGIAIEDIFSAWHVYNKIKKNDG
jgi:alanine dehydrogenase